MPLHGVTRAQARQRADRRHAGAVRRATVKAAPVGDELTLDALYARDGGWCALCGTHVPRDQASKDHKQPLAKGGARDASNEQLAHLACNSAKGDRVGPKRKGLRRKPIKRKPRVLDLPDDVF